MKKMQFDAHSCRERDILVRAIKRFLSCQTPDRKTKCAPNDEDFEFARHAIPKA